ncbi:UNVERIFIED_CONTAM: hypothetical protein FKN15_025008, partial [Acipenser sinensis]
GDITSRITTDTNTMSESLSEKLSLLMWYFMRVLCLFGSMLRLSWKLSLFTAIGLPIIWVIPELTGKFYQKLSVRVQESLAKANAVAMETFSSMKTVRSFANEEGEAQRYRDKLEETYRLNKIEAAAYAASSWTNSLSSLALKVSILYYGGMLVTSGDVSSGDLVSFVLYELQFSSAVEVALVSQEPVLFARSVQENISYGVEQKSEEEVQRAAKRAIAHDFITELQEGYGTDAGEKGGQLSGGQKQRVAIARALLRDPRILILDDATSSLDTETEHLVQSAVLNGHRCSVLLISHRLSSLERADRIIVLQGGEVVEQGSHSDLLQRGGVYQSLLEKQSRGFDRNGVDRDQEGQPPHNVLQEA